MKPRKNSGKNGPTAGNVMYIIVIAASVCLIGANVFLGVRKDKVQIVCESGSFFDRMKDDYPELDVVVTSSVPADDVTRSSTASTAANVGMININTASAEELETLSGIGETKAAAIVQYRTENGAFKSIEEICRVKGIGDATFNKIRDRITV